MTLWQLCHSVWELEKVNHQFTQLLDSIKTQAPCQPTPQDSANNLQQPQLVLPPQHDCTPKLIIMLVPTPAPNPPASLIQRPAHQLNQIDCHPCPVPGQCHLSTTLHQKHTLWTPSDPSNYNDNNSQLGKTSCTAFCLNSDHQQLLHGDTPLAPTTTKPEDNPIQEKTTDQAHCCNLQGLPLPALVRPMSMHHAFHLP